VRDPADAAGLACAPDHHSYQPSRRSVERSRVGAGESFSQACRYGGDGEQVDEFARCLGEPHSAYRAQPQAQQDPCLLAVGAKQDRPRHIGAAAAGTVDQRDGRIDGDDGEGLRRESRDISVTGIGLEIEHDWTFT
jgi:hypothetical protein